MGINWTEKQPDLVAAIFANLKPNCVIEVDADKMCDHFRQLVDVDSKALSNKTIKDKFAQWKISVGLPIGKGGRKGSAEKGKNTAAADGSDAGDEDAEAGEADVKKAAPKGGKRKGAPAKPKSPKKAKVAKGKEVEKDEEKAEAKEDAGSDEGKKEEEEKKDVEKSEDSAEETEAKVEGASEPEEEIVHSDDARE